MRSISLPRFGAERTRTQVLATAYSHRPVSTTATIGGGAGLGATMAGSTGDGFAAVATGDVIVDGVGVTTFGAAAGADRELAAGALTLVVSSIAAATSASESATCAESGVVGSSGAGAGAAATGAAAGWLTVRDTK